MKKYGFGSMLLPVLLIVLANGIATFAYVASRNSESPTLWAILAVNYLFFLGLTQTGIVFSAIMRVAKSTWALYFNRLGEVLTLSYIPVGFVGFIILYFGGAEHLFYWMQHGAAQAAGHAAHAAAGHAAEQAAHGAVHSSPWLRADFFIWRYVVIMPLFYFLSYLYFRGSREEESYDHVPDSLRVKMNFLGGFVMFFYVWANTNLAWDFAMMIIPHWESTIFPGYYWVGNLLAGPAFLYLLARVFIKKRPGDVDPDLDHIEPMGKLFMGFVLTWIYMFWSQHIVEWYPELTERYGPVLKQMSGHFLPIFIAMMLAIFILPFFFLMFRRIKLTTLGITVVAILLCIGLWLNRYLMIVPVYTDGSEATLGTYVNISLFLGFLSAALLSLIFFFRLFPDVTIRVDRPGQGGH
jgi:hypothetical protein